MVGKEFIKEIKRVVTACKRHSPAADSIPTLSKTEQRATIACTQNVGGNAVKSSQSLKLDISNSNQIKNYEYFQNCNLFPNLVILLT